MPLRSKLLAPAALALGFSFIPMQCAPAPHPVDCAQRDENGDGAPDNGLSANGLTFTCTYSHDFQDQAGYEVVFVTILCAGQWINGPEHDVRSGAWAGIAEQKAQAFCPWGVQAGFGNDRTP